MRMFIRFLILLSFIGRIGAQERNLITTATPFLLIATDARAGGMGDLGVATSADSSSQFWNASKGVFLEEDYSIGVIYTPWLRQLTDDIFLGGVTFTNKLNERSAWGMGMRYFNLGEIELTNSEGLPMGTDRINELSVDGSYSLKLSDTYSMGVSMRYIRSDLGIESVNSDIKNVNTVSFDLNGFYQSREKKYKDIGVIYRGGFNISNIGPKVSYSNNRPENYIPTNLKLGGGVDLVFRTSSWGIYLEVNKLLVPTPHVLNSTGSYKQEDTGFLEGIFQSFSDAPGGGSEELKEITWAVGTEYLFDRKMALRAGFFYEDETKGSRKYFTLGAGFKFNTTSLDVSYLLNASAIKSPLENTLRFSLTFEIFNQ